MKNSIFILILINLLSCNCNRKVKESIVNKQIQSIIQINESNLKYLDSLGFKNYLLESKWKMYLKYCDVVIEKKDDISKNNFYGEADLLLFGKEIVNDTLLSLYFVPLIEDSLLFQEKFQFKNKNVVYSYYNWLLYDIKNHSFYGYMYDHGMEKDSSDINNYCNDIKICNKKEFIKINQKILNP